MAGRAHLSIGEVLSLLHDEFPDVTISKIRFLESQGLVDPERTPSGYRKFYEEDIERLRWVLRQQRDSFLPLKVIKGRLEGQTTLASDEQQAVGVPEPLPPVATVEPVPAAHIPPPAVAGLAGAEQAGSAGAKQVVESALPGVGDGGGEAGSSAAPGEKARSTAASVIRNGVTREARVSKEGALVGVASASEPRPAPSRSGRRRQHVGTRRHETGNGGQRKGGEEGELTLEELVSAAGVDVETVRDLERYGLIVPRFIGGAPYYSREAALIAGLAAAFARHGVEARHLRAYKGAAEREAGMVQQVVMPLIRQRNPEARRAAAQAVEELSSLGAELRAVLLGEALADVR